MLNNKSKSVNHESSEMNAPLNEKRYGLLKPNYLLKRFYKGKKKKKQSVHIVLSYCHYLNRV